MNLQETVEYIFNKGAESSGRAIVDHPNNPDKRLVIGPDGVKELDTPRQPPTGTDTCYSVEDFAARLRVKPEQFENSIWYDECSATCYSNDTFRRQSIAVAFPAHPILRSVQALASQRQFDQKQVLRLLRIDLAGLVDDFVISRFRSLNWDSAKRARQVITHGKSSLDAEVRSSVTTDDGEVPEGFVVTAPLFSDMRYRSITFPARVAVDLEVETQKIGLILIPGTTEDILTAQRQSVESFLKTALDDEFQLICGKSVQGK